MNSQQDGFSLSLKISGQSVKLYIKIYETYDDVFQKLRTAYPNCLNKKKEILQKLQSTLRTQIQKHSLNQELLTLIEAFLQKNNNAIDKSPLQRNEKMGSISKKYSLQNNKSIHRLALEDKDPQQNIKIQNFVQKKLSFQEKKTHNSVKPHKKYSTPLYPSKNQTPNKNQRGKSYTNNQQKGSRCNPDLIKACQNIMKKAQNNQMKQMAKQFLRQKGVLKEQQKQLSHKKKLISQQELSSIKQISMEQKQVYTEPKEAAIKYTEKSIQNIDQKLNLIQANKSRNYGRSSKYKYLQSSLINQSLSKEYDYSSALLTNEGKPKKYSYLDL